MVWLDNRNLLIKKPKRKLESCHIGKYFVKKVINPYAIKLNLLSDFCIYPVFYINLLKLQPLTYFIQTKYNLLDQQLKLTEKSNMRSQSKSTFVFLEELKYSSIVFNKLAMLSSIENISKISPILQTCYTISIFVIYTNMSLYSILI